jgi:hypothetical protein
VGKGPAWALLGVWEKEKYFSFLQSENCLESFKVGETIKKKIRHNKKGVAIATVLSPSPEPAGLAPECGKSSLGWPRLTPGMWPQLKWGQESAHTAEQSDIPDARPGKRACGYPQPGRPRAVHSWGKTNGPQGPEEFAQPPESVPSEKPRFWGGGGRQPGLVYLGRGPVLRNLGARGSQALWGAGGAAGRAMHSDAMVFPSSLVSRRSQEHSCTAAAKGAGQGSRRELSGQQPWTRAAGLI